MYTVETLNTIVDEKQARRNYIAPFVLTLILIYSWL